MCGREWQMERAFQTALWLLKPEIVFILGDIFDEGKWSSQKVTSLSLFCKMFVMVMMLVVMMMVTVMMVMEEEDLCICSA